MYKNSSSSDAVINIGTFSLFTQQILGKGATGTVYRAINNKTKQTVAVKCIDLKTIKDEATRSLLDNQKAALRCISNPHVLKLIDIIQQNGFCYIVTDLCEGQTLKEYILKKGKLALDEAMTIFHKILIGCLAITQNCIIHRDLKPSNILIDKLLNPIIIDFGFCQIIRAKKIIKTFNVGSPSYMSPQAYLKTLYSQKSDSYSLGMILYEMLHGKTLDEGKAIRDYYEQLKNNNNLVSRSIYMQVAGPTRQIIQKSLKYSTEERASVTAMKYLVDVFNLKRQTSPSKQLQNHFNKIDLTFPPNNYYTYQQIQKNHQKSERSLNPHGGRITFSHTSINKAMKSNDSSSRQINIRIEPNQFHRTSQTSLARNSSASRQNRPNTRIVLGQKPKQTNRKQFKLNDLAAMEYQLGTEGNEEFKYYQIKKQQNLSRSKSKDNSIKGIQTFTSTQIDKRRSRGKPVFRHVTVKFLQSSKKVA